MSTEWSLERILSLAPDASSSKAGQGLGASRFWSNVGTGQGLVWGECQGSGAKPYQTKLDPSAPAFSCSCPSRKFPCKHGLGLMIVWAEGSANFTETELPSWVISWKENREKRADAAAAKEKPERPPTAPAAKAKREGARIGKVSSGLDDLSLWIADLVRQGFTTLNARPKSVWDDQARRMVDAQAPGVARRLRQIGEMSFSGDGWHTALLDKLARIHLIHEGFKRIDTLSIEVAEDLRATIGFTTSLESVRAEPGVRDHWQVIGQSATLEDRLTVIRSWLVGRETGRSALVLDFIAGMRPVAVILPPGFGIDAELAFFPGAFPLRAVIKERFSEPVLIGKLGGDSIAGAFGRFAAALTKNPWIELIPVVLEDVFLQGLDGVWSVHDALDATMPLSKRFQNGWQLLALGGGGPITITGEFDGASLEALSARAGDRFFLLTSSDAIEARGLPDPPAFSILTDATASAVLGVDRKPPPKVDGPLAVEGLAEREPAPRLLGLAAASSLYARAGRKPTIDHTPLAEPCPPDETPTCSLEASARLRKIFSGEQGAILPEWLKLLAKAGKRLPTEALAEALRLGKTRHELRPAILAVLGNRGRWLASLNREWDYVGAGSDFDDPEGLWQTGTRPERLSLLRRLRLTDLDQSRSLIASTWTKEPADDRAAFLEAFEIDLSLKDEPFLESGLDDRSKAVRNGASRLLARLTGSRLSVRMLNRTLPWLIDPTGKLTVVPPEACPTEMARDGIEPKPPSGVGEKAWWLEQGLALIPPSTWSQRLEQTPERLIKLLEKSDWRDQVIEGWAEAALLHSDTDWSWALLNARTSPSASSRAVLLPTEIDRKLFDALPIGLRERYVLRLLPDTLDWAHPVLVLLRRCLFPWSEALGHAVLQSLKFGAAQAADNGMPFHLLTETPLFGCQIPVSLLEDAETDWISGHLTPKNPALAASSWAPLLETLKFRRAMAEELAR